MHKKYDLYVSLGRGCQATKVLRPLNLQFWSFPFDWIYGSNMVDRAKIIKNNFDDFLCKTAFEYIKSVGKNDWFCNIKNDLKFPHDFPKNISFEKAFDNFEKRYKRRINRLIKLIESSKQVCFLYIYTDGDDRLYSDQDLIEVQQIIQSRFPNVVIDLLYFELGNNSLENKQIFQINKNIIKYSFDYSAHNKKYTYTIKYNEVIECLKGYSISLRHLTLMNLLQKYKIYKFNDDRYKKIKSTLFLLKNANTFI